MAFPVAMLPMFLSAMQSLKDDIADGQKDRLAEAQGNQGGLSGMVPNGGVGMLSGGSGGQSPMALKPPSVPGFGGGMLGSSGGKGGSAMQDMISVDQPMKRKREYEE